MHDIFEACPFKKRKNSLHSQKKRGRSFYDLKRKGGPHWFSPLIDKIIILMSLDMRALYPTRAPFEEGDLQVSPVHTLYYAQYGNPLGRPVLFLHGGPGGGCTPLDHCFFDPSFYRIILLDQRGALRSRPLASLQDNTLAHSIEDLERLRAHLGISKWLLFGGSWGATLALAYGQNHPERCLGFILRGTYLARDQDIHQLFYGIRETWPEYWEELAAGVEPYERSDLRAAYHKRVMGDDPEVSWLACERFAKYSALVGALGDLPDWPETFKNKEQILAVIKICLHYAAHHYFLKENQLLKNMDVLKYHPAILIHGRQDVICLPSASYDLHHHWPGSELQMIQQGGHVPFTPHMADALVRATDKMKVVFGEDVAMSCATLGVF